VYALEEPVTQHSAPWGLARISHQKRLNFGTFNKYIHQANGGKGVDVYVIDTGTNIEHVDFEGRASWGKTIPTGDVDEDGNGHGTHCSGTVAGRKYGVAKKANIRAVKVLRSNGSGTMSDVVKGVEFAAEEHQKAASKKDAKFKGSAANMSLGGGKVSTRHFNFVAVADNGSLLLLIWQSTLLSRPVSILLLLPAMTILMLATTLRLPPRRPSLSVLPPSVTSVPISPTMAHALISLPPD
jgi:hypothetical protein